LLNLTQTKVKTNPGIDDFIYQLIKSHVSPDLIINEIIKTRVQLNEIKNIDKRNVASGFDLIQNQDVMTSTENISKNDASTDYDIIQKQDKSISTDAEIINKKDFSTNTDLPILKNALTETEKIQSLNKLIQTNKNNLTNTQMNETKNVSTETMTPSTSDKSIQWDIPSNEIPNKIDAAVGPDVGTRMTRNKKRPYTTKLIFDSAEDVEKKIKPNIESILNVKEPEETIWEIPPSNNE
jgi:hypothetical protein